MNKKIIIISVLLTNMVFASVSPVSIALKNSHTNRVNTLSNMVSSNLHRRGLEKSVAQKKVSQSLQGDAYTNDLMAQNILENMREIKQEDIISYISNSALYGKSVDLSSYETILSLVHKSNKLALDKADLENIHKISLENKNIKALSKIS
ncbi:hypothetical protein KJ870_10695 [bacterium]|jgi:hypothetical protein|nr:hypothetical protein [bacterium]MBU1435396.1 hypothetical protein [bacterium]MBU1502293.1 hypothetical protein [bacterium]